MIGSSMLKKLGVTTAVTVAGFAGVATAAHASPTWSSTGDIQGFGSLTLAVGTMTTTCDVAVEGTASNVFNVAQASISDFKIGVAAGGSCTSNVPSCSLTVVSNMSSPWSLTGSGSIAPFQLSLGGVSYSVAYSGGACAYNGMTIYVWGGAAGSYINPTVSDPEGELRFSNAPGVTSSLGAGTLSGGIYLYRDIDGEPGELALS